MIVALSGLFSYLFFYGREVTKINDVEMGRVSKLLKSPIYRGVGLRNHRNHQNK